MEAVAQAVVYIVDDDDAGRGSLRYLLESIGLKVAPYANPDEFLDQFDDLALGCVVLDMRLPKIGGLEVLRTLRERGTKISRDYDHRIRRCSRRRRSDEIRRL